MAGLVVLALFIVTSLSVIEAKATKSKQSARRDGPVDGSAEEPCVPGQFDRGPGCGKCFCTADRKNVCSPPGTCQIDDKVPTTEELIHIVNQEKLYLLPSVPNTGAECSPGGSYRIDCNRCLCAQTKSLVCESLLCPSYDDDNKRQANKMSGSPCNEGDKINKDCVECSCDNGSYACEAKEDCISSVALLNLQRVTTKKQPRSKSRLPLTLMGKMRGNRQRGARGQTGKNVREMPFDEALLDPKSGKKCTPHVIYRKECNNCFCTKGRQLRCTVKVCPSAKEQEIFKKMQLKFEKQNE